MRNVMSQGVIIPYTVNMSMNVLGNFTRLMPGIYIIVIYS